MNAVASLSAAVSQREADTAASQEQTKYRYPEFAGWVGERYLKKVLRQILPMALYRTWEILVEHQANGSDCYMGISQLATIAGRTSRTMQKNLAELQAKQLLAERAEYKVFAGDQKTRTTRAVVVKDFSRLYALAHEYHEWLNAANYLAPDRALVQLIAQNPPLVAKLRRFDNYRRVLYTQLPGPLPKSQEEDRWFTEYQAEVEIPVHPTTRQQTGLQANKEKAKELAKQPAKDSPKRIRGIPENHQQLGDSSDSEYPFSENAEQKEKEMPEQSRGVSSTGEEQHPKPIEGGRSEERSNTRLSHAGASCIPSPRTGGEQAIPDQAEEQIPCSTDHPLARSLVQEIAVLFGDRNPKASLTRVCSILATANLSQPDEVTLCLVRAYVVARDTRTIRAAHTDARTGHVNRMPLFCTMVDRFVQARVEAHTWDYSWQQMQEDIATDHHLARWWQKHHSRDCERTGGLEEAQEEQQRLQDISSQESVPQEVEYHISGVLSQRLRQRYLSQTDVEREERARYARTVIKRAVSMGVIMNEPMIGSEHLLCGCPLSHRRTGQRVCAHCVPDPGWPEEVHALIHSIVEKSAGGKTRKRIGKDDENFPGVENEREVLPAHGRWTEREEAYAWGKWVLKSLADSGYLAELVIRPQEDTYQVVLVDDDYEMVLETGEQAQALLAQAHQYRVPVS
jgi:hypothetical protein